MLRIMAPDVRTSRWPTADLRVGLQLAEELRVRALTGLGAEEAEAAPAPASAPASRSTG
jgi:hypothetical protein